MAQATASDYRYTRFEIGHMLADLRFAPDSPAAGDRLPNLDLQTIDGQRISFDTLDRPHLFIFGSNTCPMTASSGEIVERLHAEFGSAVHFVLVQVREAHPGAQLPQPSTMEEKVAAAQRLGSELGISFTVAIDDPDGRFHTALDPKPNAAYLVDPDGTIVFRALWASDERGLREALEAVRGGRRPQRAESTRMMGPMLRALGYIDQVLRGAGAGARRDLAVSAPPMLIGGRMAALFRGLHPSRRGPAMTVSSVVIVALVVAAVAFL